MHDHLSSRLTEKIEILTLVQDDETGDIAWAQSRNCWASVELDTRRNIFSVVGVGTRGATVVIRPDMRLTLHQAIRWQGEFLHLTSITLSQERDRQEIKAAICTPVTMTAKPQARTGKKRAEPADCGAAVFLHLPGILSELYHQNEADEVFRMETLRRVLVAPKMLFCAPATWCSEGTRLLTRYGR